MSEAGTAEDAPSESTKMRFGQLVESLLDGCLELGELLRGRKRRLAALFMFAVILVSPGTYLRVAMARVKPMLDAVNQIVLESVDEYRSPSDIDADPVRIDAP